MDSDLAYSKNLVNYVFDSEWKPSAICIDRRKHLVFFSLARSSSQILLSLSDKTLNL